MPLEKEIKSSVITVKLALRLVRSSKFDNLYDARLFLKNLNEQAIRIQNLLLIPHFQTTLILDILARYDIEQPYLHLTNEMHQLQIQKEKIQKRLKKDHDNKNVLKQQLHKAPDEGKKSIELKIKTIEHQIAASKSQLEKLLQHYEVIKDRRRKSREALIAKAETLSKKTGLFDNMLSWINEYLQTISFYNSTGNIKNYDLLKPLIDYLENLFNYEKNDVLFEKYPYSLERRSAKLFFNLRKDNLHTYFETNNQKGTYFLKVFDCVFEITFGKSKSRNAKQRLDQLLSGNEIKNIWYEPKASYLSIEHIWNNSQNNGMDDRIYLNLVMQENVSQNYEENRTRIMGIDVGVNNPLYYAIKEPNSHVPIFWEGLGLREKDTDFRKKTLMRIETLQKEIATARSVKNSKKLKALSKKINAYCESYYHILSKKIIDKAVEHRVGILKMEDLDFKQSFKSRHPIIKYWNFRSLQQKIAYKAARAGVTVQWVAPENTSKKCMHCDTIGVNLKIKFKKQLVKQSAQDAFAHNDHIFICTNTNWKHTGKNCYAYIDVMRKWPKVKKPVCKFCSQELVQATLYTVDGKVEKILGGKKSKTIYICNNKQCSHRGNLFKPLHRDANAAANIADAPPLVVE